MPLVVVVLTGIYVEIAGQDKPVGDNARKGAVKKRSQVKTKLGGATAWQQDRWKVYGGKKACKKEKGSQEIQGRASREVGLSSATMSGSRHRNGFAALRFLT